MGGSGIPKHRWTSTIRRAAQRLSAEGDLTAEEIRARLKADHGVDVPRSTIGAWLRVTPDELPITGDLTPELRRQAGRILRITDAEIRALERKPDLAKLERLARILRSLETGPKQRAKSEEPRAPRTLLDLSSEAEGQEETGSEELLDYVESEKREAFPPLSEAEAEPDA